MQLLNSDPTHITINSSERLLDILQDIVSKIEIKSDFSIHHPDYKPLELPNDVVERFQKMPNQIQQKYLGLQLRSFLYGIYYNASMQETLALDGDAKTLPLDLENNSYLGVDLAFYQQLHENNFGEGNFDPGWSVIREETDGSLAVTKGGLRLHIQRDKHLQPAEKAAVIGDSVAILLPKNRVQNGFYVSIGNSGISRLDTNNQNGQPVIVRVYFHFTPEGAVRVMGNITKQLNLHAIPFSFKVLYNPQDYKRHDSGVLYFDKRDYEVIKEVLQVVYTENKSYFLPEIPLFTKQLVPGLGLAEEPDQKFTENESFGLNRCQIVANGLLEAWHQGDNSTEGKIKAILRNFSLLEIDIQRPYLNANSEDIY
ncbi:MAG TPA: T3SS effector HopA1 family protein [Nostocaceae cyanobacterium]|nr:T3SS effector HopA1 family protein [Nostocaceae cyanobacterium]